MKTFTVNTDQRTCTCLRFQLDKMPCAHAMAAIKKGHMNIDEYCSIYYKKKTYLATYKGIVNLVENPDEWEIPEEMEKMEVEAPIKKRIVGRQKKIRLLSRSEFRKHNIKCGKCGEYGHNKKTYRNLVILKTKK